MAPSAAAAQVATDIPIHPGKAAAAAAKPWLKSSGALDQYEHIELTPVIGREYPTANVVSWLEAPNSDELIKELALTSTSPHKCTHRVRADPM
jgi:hypothetical protein